MEEHAITFDWLREYESLRTWGHWRLDLFKVLPRFPYVCTGSNDSIYDTSIIKVADILCRNSPYYVAYTRTWIFEPSVYLSGCKIEWRASIVAYSCNKLLASHAILAGIRIPPITWLGGLWHSPPGLKLSGWGHAKKTFYLGKNWPAWWWGTIWGVRIVYYYGNVSFVESRR